VKFRIQNSRRTSALYDATWQRIFA